jgi:hypothetical protein
MTPSQIDKRLDVLENRLSTEYVTPVCWVYFGKNNVEVSGWRHGEEIFWREDGEADDELRDRVLSLTVNDRKPPNGRVFIAVK